MDIGNIEGPLWLEERSRKRPEDGLEEEYTRVEEVEPADQVENITLLHKYQIQMAPPLDNLGKGYKLYIKYLSGCAAKGTLYTIRYI